MSSWCESCNGLYCKRCSVWLESDLFLSFFRIRVALQDTGPLEWSWRSLSDGLQKPEASICPEPDDQQLGARCCG